ncbi:MAG TPA: FAD-dependent oxidoreductase, partial [Candidatus Saccharimonadales bacterium]|nr:FAD-dependent oxidoreductase [Candidatus Saccharimonadales bacterium]
MSESRADLIVVGGGVAGLRAAIEAAGAGLRVVLAAKDPPADTNTDKAQGGIAAAIGEEDRVDLHYRDTIDAGAGLCDARAVRVLVDEAPARIEELLGWGVRFDRTDGKLSLTREAAHSARRVLHAGGDATGREILRALLEKALSMPAISWSRGTFVVDLLVEGGRCTGALCLDAVRGLPFPMRGRVLLATGGCGQVYRETTNPPQATGDGIAIAWRAGAWLRDMEFVQFHPTALALPGAPRFLLSEALRGEGGTLEDLEGRRFMQAVDPGRAELAPRDVVSRAMAGRMAETGAPHLLLNVTSLDGDYLRGRFPSIYSTCLAYGLDITKDPIPVSPCAHYMMGGVATDLHGRTSVPGLYAAGEAACTGVHGANRLA